MTEIQWGLAEIVRRHGRERPESPAITCGESVIDWAELEERSNRAAGALGSQGVGVDDRVAFIGKNGREYFEVLFGTAKLGAVTVAVNWRLSPREMALIVNDAGASVLVLEAEFAGPLGEVRDSLTTLKQVVVFGAVPSGAFADAASYEDWLDASAEDPGHIAGPEGTALQLYTSGTTGLPKGAMLSNANMHLLNGAAQSMFGIDDDSVNLVVLPTFHIGGAGYGLVGMAQGCQTILLREFDPPTVLEAMQRHRVTNAFFVPAMLAAMSAVPGAAEGDYSSLRSIIYGASPITEESLRVAIRTFRCGFVQCYGMTETSGAITQLVAEDHDPDGERSHLLRSAGKPFEWIELRIVDTDTGEERASGEIGEVWTRSQQNMMGYWNNPDATGETITRDGWLRTGDAGYIDAEGYLFLTDRVKDMIVSGGENVYPIEVENVLAAHPAIADVAVIGVPDARWGETVKAVVVLKPGACAEPAELIGFCRDRIAHFKCPTSVDFIDVVPRNPSGKVLKRELREPYWSGHDRRVS
jgi:acyl-CoA synthetase (AMP-forming)/AMP-acid ligase II